MNDNQQQAEDSMPTLDEFETQLTRSAPQPREEFEQVLSQQLRAEFIQRRRANRMLMARTKPHRFGGLSTRTALILAAVLVVGAGVVIAMSTFLQQYINYDAGLKAIYDQGLGHEIGLSQSHEGFTVTLEWAYADGNRLTLAYTIQGLVGTPYTNLESNVYKLSLRDSGVGIPFYQGMGVGIDQNGDPVNWDVPPDTIATFDRSLSISTYDLNTVNIAERSALDLHLEVVPRGVTLQRRTELPMERFNEMYEGPQEPFAFDFSVPLVNDQRVMDTVQTATDQGIEVTLRQVTVSPSQTRVLVCFLPPDPARNWTAIPQLTTNEGDVPGGGGVRPFMDGDESCQDYTYFAGMFDYTGTWQLEVTELVGFGSGGGDDQQRISGSWVFEFVVP